MRLHCHPISPYARKAMIIARLKGIGVEEILAERDRTNGYTGGDNPLGKIPALEWQPGEYLFDSPVVCEFLDGQSDPMLPASGAARWTQLRLHALGDGISDAVYNYRYETVRDASLHWPEVIERHETALRMSIAYLETRVDTLGAPWEYGNLSIICALDYMSYRAGHLDWPSLAPNLAAWHSGFTDELAYKDTYAYNAD